ncbi:DUF2780 domain-containing protein [Nitrosomonas supralitoralis]|uniref:DUF2780 domain-containing protein n=1 Tax=Nitrosomonas supralitoralis TaxID=2116706 RepID=A0A2P7NT67_9PROT|nr:DUF2780 domain-containing protein [Nitrosomonas supralitoralis]PSJ16671.1 hypothetical protein C7H79_12265 [Nitrosomonas supralitoralis]
MKINYYSYFSAIALCLFVSGCATNTGGTNPLGTIDQSLSTVEGAAQSGRQILNAGAAAANDPTGMVQIGLVDILSHRLGVSPQQALGGAGAIFQMAQSNMDPQAFASISRSVPGMDSMLSAAPAMSNLSGNLSSLMGDKSNTLGNAAALAASFQQLNLSPDMIGQFVPVITNYVSKASGQAAANLLQSALTGR